MAYGNLLTDVVQSSTTNTPPVFKDGNGTQIGTLCRAWVNFNGSTSVIAAAFNVSSITKSGTGQYSVNITNSMPDTNYAAFSSNGDNTDAFQNRAQVFSTSIVKIVVYDSAYRDPTTCCVSVFR